MNAHDAHVPGPQPADHSSPPADVGWERVTARLSMPSARRLPKAAPTQQLLDGHLDHRGWERLDASPTTERRGAASVPVRMDRSQACPSPQLVMTHVLTDRQLEVLALTARFLTAVEIARLLHVTPYTVRKHLEHVRERLGVHRSQQAVEQMRECGLIQ